MSYETLKRLTPAECDFVLGKNYLKLAAQKIGLEPEALVQKMREHLGGTKPAPANEAGFYDFLTELIGLTFLLHKWGLLLFHLESELYGDWILSPEVEGEAALIVQKNGSLALEKLYDETPLFSTGLQNKSAAAELLLWLFDKRTSLEILQAPADLQRFDGNHVSFNDDRAVAQRAEILWIKAEFGRYKERLTQLQSLFVENFGKPEGLLDQPE